MANIVLITMGIALLAVGRKLFWLFVGIGGFAAGVQVADLFFSPQPFWILWAVGLFCGIIGTLLALLFQQLVVAIGGFAAGSSIALQLMYLLGLNAGGWIVLIGGVAGAMALVLFFDWALIVLSAGVGASFILEAFGWRLPYASVLYMALIAAGVFFQVRLLITSRRGET